MKEFFANTCAYNSLSGASSSKKVVRHLNWCPGQKLYVPDGMSPHCAYPYIMHTMHFYPWTVESSDAALVVCSTACKRKHRPLGKPCDPCCKLLEHKMIEGIEDRNRHGFSKNTPYHWWTAAELVNMLNRKNNQLNHFKLSELNMARSLLSHASHLDAHKQFVMAIGEGNMKGLHRLVSVSRKAGESIYTILDKCNHAVQNVYHLKSFQEQEFQQLFLFHKLGGIAVAEIAHHAFGLPSIKVTQ